MDWQEFVKDYLTFTRKERIGILVALCLIIFIFFLPKITGLYTSPVVSEIDTAWISSIRILEKKDEKIPDQSTSTNDDANYAYQYDRNKGAYPIGELFYFDPNTLPAEGWEKMGLKGKTIQTIRNYLAKGGQFKKPEDLQKIYGLYQDQYERLAPYIKIETPGFVKTYPDNQKSTVRKEYSEKNNYTNRFSIIDINTADTTAFISLPGIGSKLAARIVGFREKLGGFYSIDQVGETYGVPDSTFQKIKQYLKLESTLIRKININTATVDELKVHPYIKWSIANPIVAYRNEHGSFMKIEDIKKVMILTDQVYDKIAPYLVTK